MEYELAANGLGEEMLQTIATMLAEKIQDKEKNEEKKAELLEKYRKEYNEYQNKEAKASYVYSFFHISWYQKRSLRNNLVLIWKIYLKENKLKR